MKKHYAREHYDRQHDEIVTLLRDISGYMAALAAEQGILTPIYHDPAPGDYGTEQCPRSQRVEATFDNGPHPNGGTPNGGAHADVPQEATIPPASDAHRVDPGTREGEAAKPPQNAACEWPTERGLYWISGESDDGPCQGVASLTQTAPGARELTLIDGTGATTDAIWEIAQDRLYACVPLTCVPTALLDNLYDASPDSYGRANEAIHDLEQWVVDHGTVTE
jgi:hypothetical protein